MNGFILNVKLSILMFLIHEQSLQAYNKYYVNIHNKLYSEVEKHMDLRLS